MYKNIIKSKLKKFCSENEIINEDYGFMQYINELFYRGSEIDIDDSVIDNAIVDGQCDKQIDLIQIEEDGVVTIRIMQVKKTEGFSSNILVLLKNGLDWIFERDEEEVKRLKNSKFRDRIFEVRDILENNSKSNIYVDVAYITLGNKKDIIEEDEINAEINDLVNKYSNMLPNFRFELYGAKEISDYIDLQNNKCINAKFSIIYDPNVPSIIENRYDHVKSLVCNIKAKELIKIFKDQGNEYLFEQNVRKYLDEKSKVNKNIIETAEGKDSEYFWALNNGVTIICDKYECIPIGGKATVSIENLQIINGCQTSMSLYAADKANKLKDDTSLLLRIHQTNDSAVIEKIIISTNNQNPINPRDLVSNSDEQIKIQKYFYEVYKVKYQRKRNDFIDIAGNIVNKKEIVSNDKVGQAALACIKNLPHKALSSKGVVFTTENNIFEKDIDKIAVSYFIFDRVVKYSKNEDIKNDSNKESIIKFGRFHITNLIYKKYVREISVDLNRKIYLGDYSLNDDINKAINLINEILTDNDKHNLLAYFKTSTNSKEILKLSI